jgi:hypothetical protein
MPKPILNPLTGEFDYINKNSDFSISGLKDLNYVYPSDGDVLTWNNTIGKWSAQAVTSSPNLDGGFSNSTYGATPTLDGGDST